MKINKYIALTCGIVALSSFILFNNKEINNKKESFANERLLYNDTKYKSADAQFESSIGFFTEIPLFDNNNEKTKNVLYSKTSRENLSKDNLMEVRDIVLQSGYKYDEVIMVLEDNYCLKYNPFTNEFNYGTLSDNFKFDILKTDSL